MFADATLSLFEGFMTTLEVFALTLLFALPLGLIICFASMCKIKPIKWITKVFIWIIRGTPLMLQLIVIYYGPGLIGASAAARVANGSTSAFDLFFADWECFDRFLAVMIAFVINYACYFSEIYRGGIEGIPKGQYEAGQVLGLSKIQVFFKIVLPQVIKRIIPPMSNEIITLVKDTSLSRIINVYEIIWCAQQFSKSHAILWPLFYTAVFYLAFCGILTLLFGYIEKKLNYYKN